MTYTAHSDERGNWHISLDSSPNGGSVVRICGAVNEAVARETAMLLSAYRAVRP